LPPTIQGEGLRITEDMVEKSCQTDTQHLGASIEQDVPDAPSCECSGEDGDYRAKQTGEGGIGKKDRHQEDAAGEVDGAVAASERQAVHASNHTANCQCGQQNQLRLLNLPGKASDEGYAPARYCRQNVDLDDAREAFQR